MSDHHDEHHHRPVWHYLAIAVVLTGLTFIEIGPLFEWFNLPVPALIGLSVVKFAIVVALFMHLWDDENVYTQIFVPPLFGGLAMVLVLMVLFSGYTPSPGTDSFPVAERNWSNYSGECQSWLRSHVSNQWYCASPPVNAARLALYNQPSDAAGGAKVDFGDLTGDALQAKMVEVGEGLYGANCVACHQANGKGIPGAFPPLAGSDYIDDPLVHARIVVHGLSGEIVVNGVSYNAAMTPFGALSDEQIAAIVTYERNSWGNAMGMVTPEQVASVR